MMFRIRLHVIIALFILSGFACAKQKKKSVLPPPKYATSDLREVPECLKGSLIEITDVLDIEPFPVSGFGLVANLDNTGGGPYPNQVRDYMTRMMVNRGFGRPTMPQYRDYKPEVALASRQFAIAEVMGMLPPGVRKGQTMDLLVRAMANSETTSLARGQLYQTELFLFGTRDFAPSGSVNVFGRGGGQVFVNPAHLIDDNATPGQKASLRRGVVMDGGQSTVDRPIRLMLRRPQRSTARHIERIINRRFQTIADKPRRDSLTGFTVAEAQDEGILRLYVPQSYRGDWRRFVGVTQHLYMNQTSSFLATKARQLSDAAQQPGAMLENISYAWEAIGQPALPFVTPLMTHEQADVAYAAARAVAMIGDPTGPMALMRIAQTPDHPFQVQAVRAIGSLEATPAIREILRGLLASEQSLVRVEAYSVLAAVGDSSIYTRIIGPSDAEQRFVLDVINTEGAPLIYATQTGIPRLAIFGRKAALQLPVTFAALDNSFSVSSMPGKETVTLFYRSPMLKESLTVLSRPDLAEIVARLGGHGAPDQPRFTFTYGEVVALVQAMSREGLISAGAGPQAVASAFILQDPPVIEDTISDAPPIPDGMGRPQEVDPVEQNAASNAAN